MSKCIECGAEVKQTEGRRPRKFCDNKGKCRLAHWNKNNPKAGKYVLKTTYDALEKQLKEVLSKGYDKDLLDKVQDGSNSGILAEVKKDSVPYQNPNPEVVDILAQIKAIRGEKIPPQRDTAIGRKYWAVEQKKRISELESKLK